MNNINWSQAPEGATQHATMNRKNWIYWLTDEGYYWINNERNGIDFREFGIRDNYELDDFEDITPRPTPEPLIYTVQMYDAGEQVKVGMECLTNLKELADIGTGQDHRVKVNYISDKNICYDFLGLEYKEQCIQIKQINILPIDTRSDTEKAFEIGYLTIRDNPAK